MKIIKLSIFLLLCTSVILADTSFEELLKEEQHAHLKSLALQGLLAELKKEKEEKINEAIQRLQQSSPNYDLAKGIREVKFPENPDVSNIQDGQEMEDCPICIKILKEYNRLTAGLLDNPYNTPDEIYNIIEKNNEMYQKNDCDTLLRKINFTAQLANENQTTIDKILRLFRKIQEITGLTHPTFLRYQ